MSKGMGRQGKCFCLAFLCLFLAFAAQALAAEEPPYEFDATLSLTGGCGTSTGDPVADPGCPERKPPKSFTKPEGIAIDSFGDEYVTSYGAEEGKQGRIDVFSPEGVFIVEVKDEFGPKAVAVDSKGVLYTFDQSPGHNAEFARYKPTEYKPEEGKMAYGSRELIATDPGSTAGGIAIDLSDHVFVDWSSSIKEYNSGAEGNELKGTITNERLQSSTFVAIDAQRRRLYASSCPTGDITKCWVLVFDADTHELLKEVKGPNPAEEGFFSQKGWISVAVYEETGDFFVGDLEQTKNVYQYNESYELVSTLALSPALFEGGEPLQIAISNVPQGTKNHRYLFVPSLKGNRALAYSPPKEQPPVIKALVAAGISEDEAELQALVEPRGGEARYTIEYLSQAEYEEAGHSFEGAAVAREGTIAPAEQEAKVSAAITSLEPGVEYRFRVTAENNAGAAEPKEATFTTYNAAPISNACKNQALRVAYSALLSDCRAYELVTPADMGGQPPTGTTFAGDNFPTVKASPGGDVVSFLTHGGIIPGLGGTGSYNGNPYRTARTAGGWSTEYVGPSGEETTYLDQGSTSPDEGYSFWAATREGSAVIEGEDTRYVRYPDGHSALIGRGSLGTDPRARGKLITEGGTHIVFQTRTFNGSQPVQLEEDAPPTGTEAVYDRTLDEVTHVVSIRPDGEPFEAGENAKYVGASIDGEGIAFSVGNTLYLRVSNATTYEIGEGVEFAGVSEEGNRIFYVEGGDLHAFDIASEEVIEFTDVGNAVPVNVSADGTRAYFVSTTAIAGSGENPNGATAEAGQHNLYLSGEGTISFVAKVTERDVVGEKPPIGVQVDGLGLWVSAVENGQFAIDPSRLNPDGTVLLFQSRATLDGYAHEGVPEIYRYDSIGNRLHCISCIPTKSSPTGGASLESFLSATAPFNLSGFVPNLRADGLRAFFQSTEALVSRDNDGVQDIYEWEEEGVGSCTRSGGCVYLISSGRSSKDNFLYASTASGDDVFFTTSDILVGGDNDAVSIYDARVNGGFAEEGLTPCEEAGDCSNPSSPIPRFPTPESEGVATPVPPRICLKGRRRVKRHGNTVCVKKKHHHKKHKRSKKGAGK